MQCLMERRLLLTCVYVCNSIVRPLFHLVVQNITLKRSKSQTKNGYFKLHFLSPVGGRRYSASVGRTRLEVSVEDKNFAVHLVINRPKQKSLSVTMLKFFSFIRFFFTIFLKLYLLRSSVLYIIGTGKNDGV